MRIWITGILGGAMVFAAGMVFAEEKEMDVKDMPEPVQAAVKAQAGDAKVLESEVEEKDGRKLFTVEVEKDGKKQEFHFSADGKVVKESDESGEHEGKEGKEDKGDENEEANEQKIELSAAPAAVRDMVAKALNGAAVKSVTREEDDGAVEYEVEYMKDDAECSLTISEAGLMVEQEDAVSTASLPAAVAAAVAKECPGGTVVKAELARKHTYELKVIKNGKTREVVVTPSGEVEESGHEHEGDEDKD